jgi:hypothetical protein
MKIIKKTGYTRNKQMSLVEMFVLCLLCMIGIVFIAKYETLIELQKEENKYKLVGECNLPFELERNRYVYGDISID